MNEVMKIRKKTEELLELVEAVCGKTKHIYRGMLDIPMDMLTICRATAVSVSCGTATSYNMKVKDELLTDVDW